MLVLVKILLAVLAGAIYSAFGYMYVSLDNDIRSYDPWKIFLIWLFWPIHFSFYIFGAIGVLIILISVSIYISTKSIANLCYILYRKIRNKLR